MRLGCRTARFFVFSCNFTSTCHLKSLDWHIWKIYLYCTSWILIYVIITRSKYLINFFLDLWPDMSFPGCCRDFLFSWRNPRSIRGSGVDSKEICWRMWKRWGTEPVADHVKRGGGKGQKKGHSPPLPLPFPFLRKSTQGRECIVRMLSTLVYICFVRGVGGGGGWFRVILEHNWSQRSDFVFQLKGFVSGDITFNFPSLPTWLF